MSAVDPVKARGKAATPASWLDRLAVWPQYLLPQHGLSRIMHTATRSRWRPWKELLIDRFCRHYGVDMSEAAQDDLLAFESFNAFFTRALRPGARTWPDSNAVLACPVDGALSQAGRIEDELLLQAKGRHYTLIELLGGDGELAEHFRNGSFATLYLSPRDYHRIHMPTDGTLVRMTHVPGDLFAVNPRTARVVDNLFARNERVITIFQTSHGPLALIMVGAIFVGSMETVWAGTITPSARRTVTTWSYGGKQAIQLKRGEEMGRFNMGSTVILLLPKGMVNWRPVLVPESPLRLGQPLGDF
jgi:phosphatidylserine decarboxylase